MMRLILVAAVFLMSWRWYGWLAAPPQIETCSLYLRALLGLLPIALAMLLAGPALNGRIWAHAAVAAGMIMALPVAPYPHSPDMAFHLGKVLWASQHMYVIDPAMGISTSYPWLFHAVWGELARLTHSEPIHLLRIASLLNVAGIIGVAAIFARRWEPPDGQRWLPWLCCLPLIAKDTSYILLATPSTLSIPIAIAGWWGIALARASRGAIQSSIALLAAAVLWPGHIFAMAGVAAVFILRRPREPRTHVLTLATVVALAIIMLLRFAATGSFATTGAAHWHPTWGPAHILVVLRHVLSLGGDANGGIVAAACTLLTLLLVGLAVLGWRQARAEERFNFLPGIVGGLLLGMVGAVWFMVQPAFWSRLASLVGFALVPFAALGIRRLQHVQFLRASFVLQMGRVALGSVWLVPFLAAYLVNADRAEAWPRGYGPVTTALESVAHPLDRVWATPETMTQVVMGRMPVFGFLGHQWAGYYAAPAEEADSISNVYHELSQIETPLIDTYHELRSHGVAFVVLSRIELDQMPLGRTLQSETHPIWQDANYSIFSVSGMHADVESPPAP